MIVFPLRGDMIEVYKILHGYYDPEAAPCLYNNASIRVPEVTTGSCTNYTVISELQKVLIHCESSRTME